MHCERVATPDTSHVVHYDGSIYEPAEDTFLLLDALQLDASVWLRADDQPTQFLEMGCGSGCVTTFAGAVASAHLRTVQLHAMDINPQAVECTRETARKAGFVVDAREADFGSAVWRPASFDVVVCNPPYVVTSDEEWRSADSTARAYAGGKDGCRETDRLLPQVARLLRPGGFFYLLLLRENKPAAVARRADAFGLKNPQKVLGRQCRNENLLIVRFQRSLSSSQSSTCEHPNSA